MTARGPFALLLVLAITTLPAPSVRAGAWIRPAGSLYAKASYSFFNSHTYYTRHGLPLETADYSASSFDFYAELGLGKRFDAVLRFPAVKRFAFETSEVSLGVGDPMIELRRGILSGRTPVTAGLGVDLAIGDADGSTPLKGAAGEAGGSVRLPRGDGETNIQATLTVSHSFHPVPAWVTVSAGYNLRTEGYTDEYVVGVQTGLNPVESLRLSGFVDGRGPVRDPDPGRELDLSTGLGEGVQYTGIGGGAAWRFSPAVTLSIDAMSSIGHLTNIYGGRTVIFGLSFEY